MEVMAIDLNDFHVDMSINDKREDQSENKDLNGFLQVYTHEPSFLLLSKEVVHRRVVLQTMTTRRVTLLETEKWPKQPPALPSALRNNHKAIRQVGNAYPIVTLLSSAIKSSLVELRTSHRPPVLLP